MTQSPRILSFNQIVLDADPAWNFDRIRPWIYEFSNGRLFYQRVDPYEGGAPGDGPGNGTFLVHGNGHP